MPSLVYLAGPPYADEYRNAAKHMLVGRAIDPMVRDYRGEETGNEAAIVEGEAKRRGKWVHMGRVNSAKRIAYALGIGCDSFDGTKWAKWSAAHRPTADRTQTGPLQLVAGGAYAHA